MTSSSPTSPSRSARATSARSHTPKKMAGPDFVGGRVDSRAWLAARPRRSAAPPRGSVSVGITDLRSASCLTNTQTMRGRRRASRRRRAPRPVRKGWPVPCVTPSTQSTSTRFDAPAPTSTENHRQTCTKRSCRRGWDCLPVRESRTSLYGKSVQPLKGSLLRSSRPRFRPLRTSPRRTSSPRTIDPAIHEPVTNFVKRGWGRRRIARQSRDHLMRAVQILFSRRGPVHLRMKQ
jgi:hypothetical protein